MVAIALAVVVVLALPVYRETCPDGVTWSLETDLEKSGEAQCDALILRAFLAKKLTGGEVLEPEDLPGAEN